MLGGRVNVQGHVHGGEKGQQAGTLDTALPALWGGHVAHSLHFSNSALLTQAEGSCRRSPDPDEIVPRIN